MKDKILNDKQIVIASHNEGKIEEFKSLLYKYKISLLTSSQLNIKDVEEVGKTFEENAIIKAKSISGRYICLSDDSGLCVNSLNGKPGIFSARFAKESGGWEPAMERIYKEIIKKNKTDFQAKFVCVIALKWLDSQISLFRGEVFGKIVWPPKGKNGFGYDPIFKPNGSSKTFAEMSHRKKIYCDHRYEAFLKLSKEHLIGN